MMADGGSKTKSVRSLPCPTVTHPGLLPPFLGVLCHLCLHGSVSLDTNTGYSSPQHRN